MGETEGNVQELQNCITTIRYFHHGLQSTANGVQSEQKGGLGLGSLLPPWPLHCLEEDAGKLLGLTERSFCQKTQH